MTMTTTSSLDSVVAAYNLGSDLALRKMLHFDQVATVKPTKLAHAGSSVTFTIYDDLAPNTTPLTETVDVASVAMSDDQTTVTLNEYGNAVTTTAKLRGTGFLTYDAEAAEKVGRNAGESVDLLARNALAGGSNIRYSGGVASRDLVDNDDIITTADVKYVLAKLRAADAPGWNGQAYVGFMHPDIAHDYRSDTGANNWDEAAIRSENGSRVWNGFVGRHLGVDWVETSNTPLYLGGGEEGGDYDTDVYATIVVGKGCLAKAWSKTESAERPQVRIGPVTDKLQRFRHVGWYWLGGYARYREECLFRIESASSIGVNAD